MRNLTIAIVIAIGIVMGNVGSVSAAKPGTCVTEVIIDSTAKVTQYGTVKGLPATLIFDDCTVESIAIQGKGIGGNQFPHKGGAARVSYGVDAVFGFYYVYITGTNGAWKVFNI